MVQSRGFACRCNRVTARLPVEAQRRFHRYVAILISTASLVVAAVEINRVRDLDPARVVGWVGYLVILVWAVYVVRSGGTVSALPLVLAQISFWASLVLVEAMRGMDLTSFDYVTAFGTIMMLGVLAGTLAAESRLVWAVAIAAAIATWAATVGSILGDPLAVIAVRAVVALAGVTFTTALVSKLFDQLAYTIVQYERSRRLQDAIARCSEALLVRTDSFGVYEAVKAILEATDADYGYVDRTIDLDGDPGWEIVADAAKRAAGFGQSWRLGNYTSTPTLWEALSEGEAVVVHTDDLEGKEQELYLADGIRSEVSVPIFVEGEFRGSIGFVQYTSDRRWHNTEIQTLWRAAHMISAYWQHQDHAEALRSSNESKDRLLASVSHEIRTPLTAIVGLSEEISAAGDTLSREDLDELNGIIALQSQELAELVEDLLVASRADFGNLSIRFESFDLRTQAERVAKSICDSQRTQKVIETEGETCLVRADPLRVRQILRNLLTNAIKYGGEHIVLVVGELADCARLVVADDGPGIPAEEADLIFERYYRSSHSPTQPGSVGIGLAVSRQLADLMGGSLEYVIDGSHHHFELRLPLSQDDPTPAPKDKADGHMPVKTG